nr:type III secretion system chaperone [Pseudomonas fluorescens]
MGHQLGASLNLQHGVCALHDAKQQEAVIIESPEHSDNVILHCRLGAVLPGLDTLKQLLNLNFDVSSLRGCWLALDQGDVRLCTQREQDQLDEERFCDWVSGFVVQARETRTRLERCLG